MLESVFTSHRRQLTILIFPLTDELTHKHATSIHLKGIVLISHLSEILLAYVATPMIFCVIPYTLETIDYC